MLPYEKGDSSTILTFTAGNEHWGFPVSVVQEVVHLSRLSLPPGAPPFLAGFLDLGGKTVTVVRLAVLLGLAQEPDFLYTPVIILKGRRMGLLVASVTELLDSPELSKLPADHLPNDYVLAGFTRNGRPGHLLDPEKLLLGEEERRLAELRLEHERRLARLEAGS